MDEVKAKALIQKVQASILMLEQIQTELQNLLNVVEETKKPFQVEETWLGDDGKEYKKETPYIKAKQWYCCGQPLVTQVKNGKQVFHCEKCNSNYGV